MRIKKNFFAPSSKGLGATRRAAMLLLVMMLAMAQTAWATTRTITYTFGTYYVKSGTSYGKITATGDVSKTYDFTVPDNTRNATFTFSPAADISLAYSSSEAYINIDEISSSGEGYICGANIYGKWTLTITSSDYITNVKFYNLDGELRAEQDNDSKTCAVTLTTKQMSLEVHAFTVTLSDTPPVYTYNISYVLNGGTNAAGTPSTYDKGTGVASLANPTRTGYTFGGWYDNPSFSGSPITSIPTTATGDVTLYAKWTANTYTVAYNPNGGSGTMSSQPFTYDVAQNLRANTFTNTGKLFDGWKDNNNNSYSASQSVSNLTATNGATVTLYAQWKADPGYITGSGTASKPYVISTKDQWDAFATESNHATYWASGKHIKLGANITGVTTTVGTQTHPFQGTFDGQGYTLAVTISETSTQGTAPFREISGATIKHLTVTGSVTGTTHAAGLVGFSRSGTNTIEDCNISASVTVNTGSNKHCGGLVGHAVTSTLTIRNSIYSGTISSGGNYAGGLQGWSDGSTLNIENCLCSGTYTGGGKFHPIAVRNSNASMSGTINGAYYTVTPTLNDASFIAADGTQAYASRQSFPCKSVTILSNTVYYAADLTPFGKTGSYTPDGTASKPYIISTTEGWNYLCDALRDNDTWNRFSGKTVRLGANIEVNRMAGSQYHDFCGIFDGQQYTLTFNYGTADSYANDEYAAPFHFVSTVTPEGGSEIPVEIKNLHVAGHIYTSAKYAAGLIAQHWGTVNVENCRVSTVIHSSVNGDGTHGGIEAVNIGVLNITGCVFDGKLLTTGTTATNNCGGFVGWHNGGTTNISNSLYAPAAIADGETEVGPGVNGQHPSATFGRDAVGNSTNSYYTRALGTAQGTAAYVYTPATESFVPQNVGAEGTAYGVSGITAYADGLKYNGKFYLVKAAVSLADNADNSSNIINNQVADVTLTGRTLYKDGKCNTLCLPFSLSAAQIAAHADFAGATLMTMDVTEKNGFDTTDGTLYLWFKTAQEIEAGVPYLVKWEKAADYEGNEASYDISNPVFEGVTVSSDEAQAVESTTTGLETVQMVGTYSPVSVTADDKSILFLGDANTLYYSTIDRQIRSCRAYFSVPYINGHAGAKARAFALSFDEEETTGILEVSANSNEVKDDAWYSLDGVRLSGKPSQRGMYINKGKKILVK